jgi:hypothetical protein
VQVILLPLFITAALIGVIAFVIYQLIATLEQAVLGQYRIDVKDNLEARKVYTQVKVLKKVAIAIPSSPKAIRRWKDANSMGGHQKLGCSARQARYSG